jgi:hypothetical protein
MKELIERRDQDDPGTATTSMKELIDRRDQGALGTATTSMKELIDRQDQGALGTVTTSMKELIDRQDQGAPVIEMTPVRTSPTAHRDPGDPGTGTNLTAVDLIVRQDASVLGTRMTSMRTSPTDHRYPDDPETGTTAGMIERGDRPLHLRPQHQPNRHGRDDPDMDSLHSPTAPRADTDSTDVEICNDGGPQVDQGQPQP